VTKFPSVLCGLLDWMELFWALFVSDSALSHDLHLVQKALYREDCLFESSSDELTLPFCMNKTLSLGGLLSCNPQQIFFSAICSCEM